MFSKLGFISTDHNYKRVFIDKAEFEASLAEYESSGRQVCSNDLTIGWRHLNLLSHPDATLAPQARASGENLNYMTLVPPHARPSGEILNYSMSH